MEMDPNEHSSSVADLPMTSPVSTIPAKRSSPEIATSTSIYQHRRPPAKKSRSAPKRQVPSLEEADSIKELIPLYRVWYRQLMSVLGSIEEPNKDPSVSAKIEAIKRSTRQVRADLSFLENKPSSLGSRTHSSGLGLGSLALDASQSDGSSKAEPTVAKDSGLPPQFRWSTDAVEKEKNSSLTKPPLVYWSHRFYRSREDDEKSTPDVKLCTTRADANKQLEYFLTQDVVGFDLEWVVNAHQSQGIKKCISLIQVANESRILLIQVARFYGNTIAELLPENLAKLLEDKRIIKTGVNIGPDCTRLETHFGIVTSGIFELSYLYRLINYLDVLDDLETINNKTPVRMALQAEVHLQLPLFKGEVRTSRWDLPLSKEQIDYAASDAYAGYQLFQVMEKKRTQLNPAPPRPMFVEQQSQPRTILIGAGQTVEQFCAENGIVQSSKSDCTASAQQRTDVQAYDELVQAQVSPAKSTVAQDATPSENSQLQAAATWAKENIDQLNAAINGDFKQRLLPSQLKAYHLWHSCELELDAIVEIWPVKKVTIAGYVDKAVAWGKLPCDQTRLTRVVDIVPRSFRARR